MSDLIRAISLTEITRLYNTIVESKGGKTVTKFSDRVAAERRLQNLTLGMERPKLVDFFKQAKLSNELIKLIPLISAPVDPAVLLVAPEAPKQNGHSQTNGNGHSPALRKREATANLTAANGKASQKSIASKKGSKTPAPPAPSEKQSKSAPVKEKAAPVTPQIPAKVIPSDNTPEPEDDHKRGKAKMVVLAAIQKLIPAKATGDDASTTSTLIARYLRTTVAAVIKELHRLGSAKLIKIEDDSPDADNPFFYVSLLPAGRQFVIPADLAPITEAPVTTHHDIPKKKANGQPVLPGSAPGPHSKFSGKKIYKLGEWEKGGNPRREGTHGFTSFGLITNGISFEEYRDKGGRNNDLQWDIDHGYVEVK